MMYKCDNFNGLRFTMLFSGYGYDDDYDAEEEYDSTEDEVNDSPKSEDENNIFKDMEKHTRLN